MKNQKKMATSCLNLEELHVFSHASQDLDQ
jgi:hypothetical protein